MMDHLYIEMAYTTIINFMEDMLPWCGIVDSNAVNRMGRQYKASKSVKASLGGASYK